MSTWPRPVAAHALAMPPCAIRSSTVLASEQQEPPPILGVHAGVDAQRADQAAVEHRRQLADAGIGPGGGAVADEDRVRVHDQQRVAAAREDAGGGDEAVERGLDGRVRTGIERHRSRRLPCRRGRSRQGPRPARWSSIPKSVPSSRQDVQFSVPYRSVGLVPVAATVGIAGESGRKSPSGLERPGILARLMRFTDVIARKRDGHPLDRDAIDAFVQGATGGSVPDYQLSALLMAIVLARHDGRRRPPGSPTPCCDRASAWTSPTSPASRSASTARAGWATRSRLPWRPLAASCGVTVPEDVGPRAGPHRRHARQARVDSRVSHRPDGGRVQARAARRRHQHHRTDGDRWCRRTRRCTPCAT